MLISVCLYSSKAEWSLPSADSVLHWIAAANTVLYPVIDVFHEPVVHVLLPVALCSEKAWNCGSAVNDLHWSTERAEIFMVGVNSHRFADGLKQILNGYRRIFDG